MFAAVGSCQPEACEAQVRWHGWEAFVANQRKLREPTTLAAVPPFSANPKLDNIDLQPYQTVQACERADILNIGGFSDSVFNVISAFLADNNQRFVAEVEAIEL